jgi:small subunit ribosomal protein S16|tara:strand:+ start:474 stop:1064 length:591 start_codon:yes stop_codon:yes gene_type:complete
LRRKPTVAVKIKLKRVGKIHAPQYRIVVADARTARNGRAIEEIGIYQPISNPSIMQVKSDRAQYWLGVGAQPTAAVEAILKVTGDWQKFKGLPGTEGTLQVAAPKPNKILAYEAAVTEAANAPKTTKPKKLEVKEEVKEAVEAVAEKVEEVVEVVSEKVEAAVEAVVDVVEAVVEKVEELVSAETPQEEAAKEETS